MRKHLDPRWAAPQLLACMLALSPLLRAQGAQITIKPLGKDVYPNDQSTFRAFHSIAIGDVTLDDFADAFVTLRAPGTTQAKGYCQWGPGIYDGALEMSWGLTTPLLRYIATVEGALENGKDLFVFTSPSGVYAQAYVLSAPVAGFIYDQIAPSYTNATLVQSGSISGGSAPDIVFANGSELRVLEDISVVPIVSSLDVLVANDRQLVAGLGTIHDLEVVHWNPMGADLVAVVATNGTYVLDAAGATVASWPYAGATTKIAVASYLGMDRLVCTYESAGSTYLVELRNGGGASTPVKLPAGWGTVVGIAAGRFDGDAFPDVAINKSNGTSVKIVIPNDGSTNKPFKIANAIEISMTGALPAFDDPEDEAQPAFYDFDEDGDEELVIGWHDEMGMGALYLVRQEPPSPREYSPGVVEGSHPLVPSPCEGSKVTTYTNIENFISLRFNVPEFYPTQLRAIEQPEGTADNYIKLDYVIWHATDAASGADAQSVGRGKEEVNKANLDLSSFDFDNDDPEHWSALHFEPLAASNTPLDLSTTCTHLYAFEVRLVQVDYPDHPSKVVARGPSFLHIVSFDTAQRNAILAQLNLPYDATTVTPMCYWDEDVDGDQSIRNPTCEIIHAGCLGIRDGLPTNPFVQ